MLSSCNVTLHDPHLGAAEKHLRSLYASASWPPTIISLARHETMLRAVEHVGEAAKPVSS